ncbi:MAG TPA: hypothetical protein VN716_18935 [Vicinamibacterales bacterium]|nr:hypothetical protein [Vicinamibacterales bacterium]
MSDEFEIHHRRTDVDDDAPWTVLPRVSAVAEELEISGLEDGVEYDVRVRKIDWRGSVSNWTYVRHTVTLPARSVPAPVDVTIADGDCLSWRMPADVIDLAGFEISSAAGDARFLAGADPAHERLWPSAPFPLCGVPGGQRTFFVVAVDVAGNRSEPAVLIDTPKAFAPTLGAFLVSVDKAGAGFPGTIDGGSVVGATLVADADSSPPLWPVGVGDATALWDVTLDSPLWEVNDNPLWRKSRGGEAQLWNFDPAAPLWDGRYKGVSYTTSIEVPLPVAPQLGRLTLDVAATPGGWRVEYRRPTGPLWGPPESLLWDADPASPLWKIYGEAWLPWPGKLERVGAGLYEFRVTMPPGTTPATLTQFTAAVTIP